MTKVNRADVRLQIARASSVGDAGRPLAENDALEESIKIECGEKLQRLQKARARQLRQACRLNRWLSHLRFITECPDVPSLGGEKRNNLNQADHGWATRSHQRIHPQDRLLLLIKPLLKQLGYPRSDMRMNAYNPLGLDSDILHTVRVCLPNEEMINDSEIQAEFQQPISKEVQ